MKNELLSGFEVLKTLSKQKFGQSYLCIKSDTNQKYVIKKLKSPLPKESIKTLEIINQINSKSIPKSEYREEKGNAYIIRDYFEGKDLKSLIGKSFHKLSTSFVIETFIQIFNILNLLHQNQVLHCDIKPSNILIKTKGSDKIPGKPEIALLDFERALVFPVKEHIQQQGFSLLYSPPEQILKYKHLYNESLDIFSACLCLYETITNKRPLYDCNAEILINLQLTYPIPKPQKMDDELFTILQQGIYKEKFPRPPHHLDLDQVNNILQNGILNRTKSASEMSELLNNWLICHPDEKKSWFSKFW